MPNDIDYNAFITSLGIKESNLNPDAKNPNSSAKGKYQFTDEWDPKFKKWGKKTPSETMGDGAAQDSQAKVYYDKSIKRDVEDLRKHDKKNKYSDAELGAMAHFVGHGNAKEFLITGTEPPATAPGNEGDNPDLDTYIKDWKEKYDSQRMAPSPEPKKLTDITAAPEPKPTPTPKSLVGTVSPTPTPTMEASPMPTPSPRIDEVISKNITPEDEPDNTLQRRLAQTSSDEPLQPPAGTPMHDEDKQKQKDKEGDKSFEYATKKQENRDRLYQLANLGQDQEAQPKEFVYKLGEDIIKSPQEFNSYVDKMTKEVYESNLSADDRAQYLSALASYEKSREKVNEAYNKAEERIDQARVFEILGHALAKIAAGWYGLKHGIDMSGVQFKLSDWSGDYKRIARRLDREVDSIEGKEKLTRAGFKDQERAAEKAVSDAERRETRAYYTEKSDFEGRESKRVTSANRWLREQRRNLATDLIEFDRNNKKAAKDAETADNKQRQGKINSLKTQKTQLNKEIATLNTDINNLGKAQKAGKMGDVEFYLGKVLEMKPEDIREISGRGVFNLSDMDDIQPLIDAKKLQVQEKQRSLDDSIQTIMNLYEGGDLPESQNEIDAELEQIRKRRQELQGQ